jgi:hypothetical protein
VSPRAARTSGHPSSWTVGIAIAGLALIVLLAGPVTGVVSASPAPTTSDTPAASNSTGPSWAYGGSLWVNASGATTALNGSATYSIHAFLGLQVLLQQVNTSATTYELTANRTMVGDVFAEYCHPSCTNPEATANLTLRASELAHASANFTTAASVEGAGGAVPALGLLNSSVHATANLAESEVVKVFGPLATHTGTTTLTVSSSADSSLAFAPALGLVPEPLSAASAWSSQSNYTGTGSWTVSYAYNHDPILGLPVSQSISYNGTVNRSGTVALVGSSGGTLLFHDGLSAEAVALRVEGPFDLREGFILVPSGGDLFGDSGKWQPDASGATTAGTSAVDYSTSGGHPLIRGSATAYAATSSTTNDSVPSGSSGLLTMVQSESDATPPGTLQAQPESYSQGLRSANCLINGDCASGAPSHGVPLGALVLGVAVVGLVVVVVGLVVARQPPRKEPATPYAPLYPPGSGGSVRAPPGRPPAPASPPADKDPLDHLW